MWSSNVPGHRGFSFKWASRGLLLCPRGFAIFNVWLQSLLCPGRSGKSTEEPQGWFLYAGPGSGVGHFCSHSITWDLGKQDHSAAKKGAGGKSSVRWSASLSLHTHQGLKVTSQLSITGLFSSHCPHLILHWDLITPDAGILSLRKEN